MNEYLANMNEFARQYKATVNPRDGRIKLEIFVDRSTVEVFVNEGESVFSLSIFPDISSDGLRLWTDDCVHIEYLKVRVVNEAEAMIY
jgi:levanbiose-producing levanase